MRVSDLKGMDVVDRNGDHIGEIVDMKFDISTMKIKKIIIGSGGLSGRLGMGEEHSIKVKHIKEIGDFVVLDALLE